MVADILFALAATPLLIGVVVIVASNVWHEITYRKIGGLHHWRMGRLGGSFYVSRQR